MDKQRALRAVMRDGQLRSVVSDLPANFDAHQSMMREEDMESNYPQARLLSGAQGRRVSRNLSGRGSSTLARAGSDFEPDPTEQNWMRLGTGLVLKTHRSYRSPRPSVDDAVAQALIVPAEPQEPPPGMFDIKNDVQASWELLTSSWLNLLLLCIPVGLASDNYGWGYSYTFTLCFVGIIPLALILGEITEDLATRFGDVIGGLINATFGNVVELMIAIFALRQDMYDVVAMSMLGSILSNLLLVMGCCFLFGGLRYPVQEFNQMTNRASNALLFLSCIALAMPMMAELLAFGKWEMTPPELLTLSRASCLVLVLIYVMYLTFQLYTHHHLFKDADEEGEEDPNMSLSGAVVLLAAITVVIALCSEKLTSALEGMTSGGGNHRLGRAFLSIVLLPIAGNACEHLTAVIVAMKNKMDLALGVAIGSSIQIAVFALPVCVLIAWAMGKPFSLDSTSMDPFGLIALTAAVIHACFVTNDATSHWMMGAQLLATYVLLSIAFLFR